MRKYSLNVRLLASAAFFGAISVGGTAQAQVAATQATDEVSFADIVVTAERRSTSLQKSALAVSVRDESTLQAEGRTSSIQRILQDVPGVDFRENTGTASRNDTGSTAIAIRGIGANGALVGNVVSLVPAVALYVDDVINGIGGAYDLDRVEILRGPQGTLYGRSATSGVVAIHTKQPKLGDLAADVSLEAGNYDLLRASGGLNIPVGESVALRVSGQHIEQDGYFTGKAGRTATDEGRIKLFIQASDALKINLGVALQSREFGSGGPTPQVISTGADFSRVAPVGKGRDRQEQYWADISLDLGFATLTYIPTLRYYEKSEQAFGFFATAVVQAANSIDFDRFTTHEVRLASNSDSRLTWQTGVFYYDNDIRATFQQSLLVGPNLAQGPKLQNGNLAKETRNLGVFAEATFAFSDTTRFTGGLRYDNTKVRIDQTSCSDIPVPSCASLSGDAGKRSWNNTTFKARLEHELSQNNLVYASVSSAFLPGDVAIVTAVNGLAIAPYEAQTLTSYEIGSKNRFMDGRLTMNASAFYYEYKGFQQGIEIGVAGPIALYAVGNSPARVKGVELETSFRPTSADSFDLNMSYLDAYFVDKPALFANSVSQKRMPRTIPFQATLAYAHRFDLGTAGSLRLKPEVAYYSARDTAVMTVAQAANPTIARIQRQDGVFVGNFYATWDSGHGYSISAYVRNIADKLYKNRVDTNGASESLNTEFAPPRTAGVVLNASF